MTIHGLGGLILTWVAVGLTVRTVFAGLWGRNRVVRILTIAGMAIVCPMILYEMIVGLDISRYADERAALLIGLGMWGAGWIWALWRRWEVRTHLFGPDANLDGTVIAENPNWVREQVLSNAWPTRWGHLLPLVDAGWNGGFAWLTPEFVRAGLAKPPRSPEELTAG